MGWVPPEPIWLFLKTGLGVGVLFRNFEIQTGSVTGKLGTEQKFKNFLISISLTSPTRPISFSKLMTHAIFHIIAHHYHYFQDQCEVFFFFFFFKKIICRLIRLWVSTCPIAALIFRNYNLPPVKQMKNKEYYKTRPFQKRKQQLPHNNVHACKTYMKDFVTRSLSRHLLVCNRLA